MFLLRVLIWSHLINDTKSAVVTDKCTGDAFVESNDLNESTNEIHPMVA